MPPKPDKLMPALYGGIVIGILSGVPGLNLINCLCCAGIMLGGIVSVYLWDPEYGDVLISREKRGRELMKLVGSVVQATGRLRALDEDAEYDYVMDVEASVADRLTIAFVEALIRECGLGQRLRDLGVKEEQIDQLADLAIQDGCHQTNPVPVTREDLKKLYLLSL